MSTSSRQPRTASEQRSERSLAFLLVSVLFVFSAGTSTGATAGGTAARAESPSTAAAKATLASAVKVAQRCADCIGDGDGDDPAPVASVGLEHSAPPLQASARMLDALAAVRPLRFSPLAPRAPPQLA